jgi:hypothetical protein
LIEHHLGDEGWRAMLHKARQAAERGQTERMLLWFRSPLCSDRGRAINAMEPIWPATLRGEAAELYLRWEHEPKLNDFHLAARILDYPGGMPGEVGLFWCGANSHPTKPAPSFEAGRARLARICAERIGRAGCPRS